MSIVLAGVAAVGFGLQMHLVDYAMDRETRRTEAAASMSAALLTLCTGVAGLWAVVLIRGNMLTITPLDFVPFVIAGVADPALARVLAYEGINRIGPALSSAILAGSPVVGALFAVLILEETVTPAVGLGLGCIVVGVGTLQLTRRTAEAEDVDDTADLLKRKLTQAGPRDLLYPIGAMTLIGSAFVVIKIGLRGVPDALFGTALTQTAAFTALLIVALRSKVARRQAIVRDRVAFTTLLLTGVVIAIAWYSMFRALQLGTVVTVLPIVSTYPLVVVGGSYLIAREMPRSPRILVSVVIIVIGAVLVQAT